MCPHKTVGVSLILCTEDVEHTGELLRAGVNSVGNHDLEWLAEFLLSLDSHPQSGRDWSEVVWVGEWTYCSHCILNLYLSPILDTLWRDGEDNAVDFVVVRSSSRCTPQGLRLAHELNFPWELATRGGGLSGLHTGNVQVGVSGTSYG